MSFPQLIRSESVHFTAFGDAVYAGFPSPADGFEKSPIDLNQHLLLNHVSSFLFRVKGESMTGIGIYDGDTLIVDRAITPVHNHIVLAVLDNQFTVKRLYQRHDNVKLLAENPAFKAIELREGQELTIWGVVTFNLHNLLNV